MVDSQYPYADGHYMHRWVWQQAHGPIPRGGIIHHIDHDPSNNASENLMLCRTQRDHLRVHRGWELREDGWWRRRRKSEGPGEPMVHHVEDDRPRRRKAIPVIRPADMDKLLAIAKEPYRTMMLLQWAVGLRPGEVCKLRRADLWLDDGKLITPFDGKTGQRPIYFDVAGRAAQALRGWDAIRGNGPYYFGSSAPVKLNTYSTTLARYCERAGIAHVKPYAFRHTFACEMMDSKVGVANIAQALGHSSPATTAAFYLHADPERMRRMNKGR